VSNPLCGRVCELVCGTVLVEGGRQQADLQGSKWVCMRVHCMLESSFAAWRAEEELLDMLEGVPGSKPPPQDSLKLRTLGDLHKSRNLLPHLQLLCCRPVVAQGTLRQCQVPVPRNDTLPGAVVCTDMLFLRQGSTGTVAWPCLQVAHGRQQNTRFWCQWQGAPVLYESCSVVQPLKDLNCSCDVCKCHNV
jgi:hypothetical protein